MWAEGGTLPAATAAPAAILPRFGSSAAADLPLGRGRSEIVPESRAGGGGTSRTDVAPSHLLTNRVA